MNIKTIHLEETDSTNRWLHDYVPAAGEEMTLVTATFQSSGRGQGYNKWESVAGKNLLFSILLHPHTLPLERRYLLSEAHALALKDVLDSYTDGISIKWPNDIYWRDYKIGGTLIETRISAGCIKDFILGTGLNINQREFYTDAPNPISLCQILGHEVPLDDVLEYFMRTFAEYYIMIMNHDFPTIRKRYHEALYRRNGFHTYRDTVMGVFEAMIEGVEDDGYLLLRDHNRTLRRYAFKEVEQVILAG
ncbi:MAG: biotin--[Prevotella sp.]|nr:biotin--[acetyl-CoA-carboxylase] ligase [Prevotella sp.]